MCDPNGEQTRSREMNVPYSSYQKPLFHYSHFSFFSIYFFFIHFQMISMCRFQLQRIVSVNLIQYEKRNGNGLCGSCLFSHHGEWINSEDKHTLFSRTTTTDKKNLEKESNQINVTYLLRARQRHIPKFLVVARTLLYAHERGVVCIRDYTSTGLPIRWKPINFIQKNGEWNYHGRMAMAC